MNLRIDGTPIVGEVHPILELESKSREWTIEAAPRTEHNDLHVTQALLHYERQCNKALNAEVLKRGSAVYKLRIALVCSVLLNILNFFH